MELQVEETLEYKITKLQNDYYNQNAKSMFIKNQQKLHCAQNISENLQLEHLLAKMVYIIPNTNKICLDYAIFKTFAHPHIYTHIVEYILSLLKSCIQIHTHYEMHINLQSFTTTAAQRYKDIIYLFCSKCLQNDPFIATNLDVLYIYNSPKMLKSIMQIFAGAVNDTIKSKIVECDQDFTRIN